MQISGYVDQILASLLTSGSVAALSYAQILYTLPVSLFGMSVAAAELPAMSKVVGSDAEVAEQLRTRLNNGLRQIAFFVVPSAMAFLALGDIIVAPIFQRGKFTGDDTIYVWAILAGAAVDSLPQRSAGSTRPRFTPCATRARPSGTRSSGWSLRGPRLPALAARALAGGIDTRWGAAGITVASGLCGWIEFMLLRRSLNSRIGRSGLEFSFIVKLWLAAAAGAAAAWAVKIFTGHYHPVILALLALSPYGIVYFAMCYLMKVPEVRFLTRFAKVFKNERSS